MSFQSDLGDHVRREYCHCPPHFEMPRTFRCSLCHKTYLPGWENKSGFRMDTSFEFIPEHYEGNFPYCVVRIKKSQLTPNLESKIREAIGNIKIGDDYGKY